jgi:carboxypeptidase Taq
VAAVNVRRWRWSFDRLSRLPREMIEEEATVTTTAQQEWAAARQNNDFAQFQPWLERVLHLKRAEAECLRSGGPSYDALLEEYEPGATAAQLTVLFAELRRELTDLLATIRPNRRRRNPAAVLHRDYAIDRQRILGEGIAAAIGFDLDRGRIDTTTHPFFSPIGPGDCRITTRYSSSDFSEALFSMLHELGHGLYEQGLDPEHTGTPFGEAPSLGLHESQSRLWENAIGRSRPFWEHFYPRVRELFHDSLGRATLDEFYLAINHVQPGFNRVRADEATYDLHVMVRFDLEQALLADDLRPGDLPAAWNEKYREYLGLAPPDDAEGCLQDGHWSSGQFGYFPTYTLGNIYAAQIFAAAQRALPALDDQIRAGDFAPLRDWLQSTLYREGARYSAPDLVRRVTGEAPNCRALIKSLRRKYESLASVKRAR